jgi:hypothetical protein
VNVPEVAVLSAPKFNTATAELENEVLYIKQPLAVKVTLVKDKSEKSVKATVDTTDVPEFTNANPPVV